jgi:hypothetical protein
MWWIVLIGLWMILVDTFQASQVVAGATAAAIGATAATAVERIGRLRFSPDPHWARSLAGRPAAVVRDTVLLAGHLWAAGVRGRDRPGVFVALAFPVGGNRPRDRARRAWAKAVGSIAPNTIVVGFDPDEHSALVHQLVGTAVIADLAELVDPP